MIVTINNEKGTTTYDVSKVNDKSIRTQATVMINKVGQLEVLLEALNLGIEILGIEEFKKNRVIDLRITNHVITKK